MRVIRERDSSYINTMSLVIISPMAFVWMMTGIEFKDNFIFIPCLIDTLLNALQVLCKLVFTAKATPADKKVQ